jgi:hypothetical protein
MVRLALGAVNLPNLQTSTPNQNQCLDRFMPSDAITFVCDRSHTLLEGYTLLSVTTSIIDCPKAVQECKEGHGEKG